MSYVKIGLGLVAALAGRILKRFANGLYDAVWDELAKGAAAAEQKWKESGSGKAKRAWVVEHVMAYIKEQADLNWFERQIVQMFVGQAVDAIVETVNEELGKDWGKQVAKWGDELADRLPWIS